MIFKIGYFLLIIFTISYVVFASFNLPNSKFSLNDTLIKGIITEFNIDGDRLKIILKGKEKVLVNYYFKTEKEKNKYLQKYKLGQLLKITGYFKLPEENRNFNLFNYRKYLLSLKINYIFIADKIEIVKDNKNTLYTIKNSILNEVNKLDNFEYVKALLLGSTNDIDEDVLSSYQKNGINHLFAVSGMHITILSLIILKILSFFNKNEHLNYFVAIIFLLFYMFLANFTPSVVRATLIFICITIKKVVNIPLKTSTILIFIACILLIYNPYYIYHVGFQFSFIISFYLIVCYEYINSIKSYTLKLLVTSIISFLASIPILINNFFTINLLSIIFNIFYIPFVTFVIFPLCLISLFMPIINVLLSLLTDIMEISSLFFSKINVFTFYFAKTPLMIFIFYYILITLILVRFKYQRYNYLILFIFCLIVHYNINLFQKTPTITLIDVGQGDSILLKLPHNNGNILIDTGGVINFNNGEWKKRRKNFDVGYFIVFPYLKSIGIKKIDYLILTHGDIDHVGGAVSIIKEKFVRNIWLNSGSVNTLERKIISLAQKNNINYRLISESTLKIGQNIFYILNNKNVKNENEDSLIVFTIINNKKILLMGDSGFDTEKYITSRYKLDNIDILKIGHHGSKYSSSEDFLRILKPKYALSSSGVNNMYNHPHNEVIERIKKYTNNFYSTHIHGNVIIYIRDKIKIKTRF